MQQPVGIHRDLLFTGKPFEFRTYEKFLSDVKHEYEQSLESMQREVSEVASLRNSLALERYRSLADQTSVQREFLERIQALSLQQEQGERERQSLRQENDALTTKVNNLQERLMELLERSREDEVLRAQTLNMQTEAASLKQELSAQADSWRAQLNHLRAGQTEAEKRAVDAERLLAQFQEQYRNTVPRQDYDRLQAECTSYQERFTSSQTNLQEVTERLRQQKMAHEHAIEELRSTHAEKLKNAAPDWEHICSVLQGHDIRTLWLRCNGMTSNDAIVLLLSLLLKNQNADTSITDAPDLKEVQQSLPGAASQAGDKVRATPDAPPSFESKYFVGLGLSSGVPKYLRFKGKVRNRKLSRRNCCLLLREVWEARAASETVKKKTGKTVTFADFFHQFLKRKFSTTEQVAEWSYNITEACKWYRSQSVDCLLFADILADDLEEEVYRRISAIVEGLKAVFERVDSTVNSGQLTGIVPKQLVIVTLRELWKHKKDDQIKELEQAMNADQQGDVVSYKWLFQNEAECTFFEVVRLQEMAAREQYIKGLEACDYIVATYRSAAVLTAIDFSRALARYDSNKKKHDVDLYVARGYGIGVEQVKLRESMPVKLFLHNLGKGVLERG
ncbi:Translin-associated factor X-interacting protein 1 [Sorochytrium milnesiophthora]